MTRIPNCCRIPEKNRGRYRCDDCGTGYHVEDGHWTLDERRMSAEGKGFVIACIMLIAIIVGAIFSNWYGVLDDRRPLPRPSRPPHPASIYYPPGEPQPKVPGDPGWRATK